LSTLSSVTQWVNQFKAGDRAAFRKLWERYFHQLVRLARRKLRGTPRREADEEDVALSAFKSFWRGAEAGRFPRLGDRNALWVLLVVITARKALDLAARERRKKGDFRNTRPLAESTFAELIGREPDPAFAAEVTEECRRLLGLLPDEDLRTIALRKMEGYTNEEVAGQLGRSVALVERRLRLIRKLWEKELPGEESARAAAPGQGG
jgi:RNA polymerase sigma factor (sigma-70 family)